MKHRILNDLGWACMMSAEGVARTQRDHKLDCLSPDDCPLDQLAAALREAGRIYASLLTEFIGNAEARSETVAAIVQAVTQCETHANAEGES